jgi:ABC-type molybdate transport system permease subunit
VVVLSVRQVKGLEFDSVLIADPAQILADSPRGLNDLYVALTRATQRLGVVYSGELPGVLAGMVLGFAKAIGEFGATITFVSNIPGETQTISSAIYSLIQTPDGDPAALRLVVVSIVIAMTALVASEWFARRALRRLHGN